MIKETHKKNWEIIKRMNLKKGTLLKHKATGNIIEILHIHSLYGWVQGKSECSCYPQIAILQDYSNIGDFKVATKEMIIRGLENGA